MRQFKPSVQFEEPEVVEAPYKKGDFIGDKYEVYDVLGWGGFGVVYLVYEHQAKAVLAMKTFRDKYLKNDSIRELFRREAQTWVDLGRHAYIVRALVVDKVSGRLYIAMEFIAPDKVGGPNSLEGYLEWNPPDLPQTLRWAIQFCHGMEYACSRGIRCHRDIKPDNIMIGHDKTVKISDFGLAGVLDEPIGNPFYMPPEQFTNPKDCDERSDIYSFGIVLYQIAADNRLPPFLADSPEEIYKLHSKSTLPAISSPLFPTIQRCLAKKPDKRYQTFKALQGDLEPLLKKETGEVIRPPDKIELEAWELLNKGSSLVYLKHFDEAISCLVEALKINPRYAKAYINRGHAYSKKEEYDRAIEDYNESIEINPRVAEAYNNRGIAYKNKGLHDHAISDFNKALEINPRDAEVYTNRGNAYGKKGEYDRAISDFNEALKINPRDAYAFSNRGNAYGSKGEYDRAIGDFNKVIEINPRYAEAYLNRGNAYSNKGEYDRAILDYNNALDVNPRIAEAYIIRGLAYGSKGEYDRAIGDFNKVIEINPRYAKAYNNRGLAYANKGEYDRAIGDYSKAIEINPRSADAYYNRGTAYFDKGEYDRAIDDFNKALEINPRDADAYVNRGTVYAEKGEHDRVILDYTKAVDINPRDALAYYNRAVAYYYKGAYDKAWEDVHKAQGLGYEVDPRFLEALREVSGR